MLAGQGIVGSLLCALRITMSSDPEFRSASSSLDRSVDGVSGRPPSPLTGDTSHRASNVEVSGLTVGPETGSASGQVTPPLVYESPPLSGIGPTPPSSVGSLLADIAAKALQVKETINKGRSVTKGSKDLIRELADSIVWLTSQVREKTLDSQESDDDINVAFIDHRTTLAIKETIKEEFRRFALQQPSPPPPNTNTVSTSFEPPPPAPPPPPRHSYAEALRTNKIRTGTDGSNAHKPAMIVSVPAAENYEETLHKFRTSAQFRSTNFAPSRIASIGDNKLRVEFHNSRQRDQTLEKVSTDPTIQAEAARAFRPMVILKGVSKVIPSGELADIILAQNESIREAADSVDDIKLAFLKSNKNPERYNAVFTLSPAAWQSAMRLERINVDHERVHVEEFSPFRQCYRCLQFGHTQSRCRAEITPCAHCSSVTHVLNQCPVKNDASATQCYNCTMHSQRFKLNINTNHKATSTICPRIRAMKDKIVLRTQYV